VALAWIACRPAPSDWPVVERFRAAAAVQGVAADATHVYVVSNRRIEKYRRSDQKKTAEWRAPKGRHKPAIRHLNGCMESGGSLYCAHSNYPEVPIASSIEVFDTDGLTHLESIPLEDAPGYATWIDRSGEEWFVCFAHYEGLRARTGRGTPDTRVVRFDLDWQPRASYSLSAALTTTLSPYSASGGLLSDPTHLLLTGHSARELYLVEIDEALGELALRDRIRVPFAGQGIGWNRGDDLLYGIDRDHREVISVRVPPARRAACARAECTRPEASANRFTRLFALANPFIMEAIE